ncbi:MAG: hypothetical protein WBC98_06430 [Candidatus Zixiibacteriota bacterium]
MRKMICCAVLLCFFLAASTSALGYIGKSIRIMGMGEELAGVMRDEYTDIYRNPAYLSFVKRVRVFGQNNLVGRTELRIAPQITNKETGLIGLVLPLSDFGNLALVGELKPSTSEDHPSKIERRDYSDRYAISTNSKNQYTKESIVNFKAIYSRRLSASLLAGIDFVYLKNYHRVDSETYYATIERSTGSDDLLRDYRDERINNSDNSPQAQRASVGLLINSGKGATFDLTLYHENLDYTTKSSSRWEMNNHRFDSDTMLYDQYKWSNSSGPVENRALGLDVNCKRDLSKKTILSLLFGGRYETGKYTWSEQGRDTSYQSPDRYSLSENHSSIKNDDKGFSLMLGIGCETRFTFKILDIGDVLANDLDGACTLGVACRGYWDQDKLDHYRWSDNSSISMVGDSVTRSTEGFEEARVSKTINSYRLSIPIGLEFVLEKAVKIRLGGEFVVRRDETESGASTWSKGYYYQGFGLSYQDQIHLDVYSKEPMSHMGDWMARVEYRF